MPTDERETQGPDLGALLEGLIKANVDFILVGGLAAVVQGAPVTTMDVDIVYNQSSENISKLLDFLESVGAIYRRPDDMVIEPKEEDFIGEGHVLLTTLLGPLDVLAAIEAGKGYDDLLLHSVEVEFRGHHIQVLDLKMLVDLKEKSEDPKDKQRLPVLKETLHQLEKRQGQ